MSKQITQIFDNKEEEGFGTVTVVTIDEDGMQYASTEAYILDILKKMLLQEQHKMR